MDAQAESILLQYVPKNIIMCLQLAGYRNGMVIATIDVEFEKKIELIVKTVQLLCECMEPNERSIFVGKEFERLPLDKFTILPGYLEGLKLALSEIKKCIALNPDVDYRETKRKKPNYKSLLPMTYGLNESQSVYNNNNNTQHNANYSEPKKFAKMLNNKSPTSQSHSSNNCVMPMSPVNQNNQPKVPQISAQQPAKQLTPPLEQEIDVQNCRIPISAEQIPLKEFLAPNNFNSEVANNHENGDSDDVKFFGDTKLFNDSVNIATVSHPQYTIELTIRAVRALSRHARRYGWPELIEDKDFSISVYFRSQSEGLSLFGSYVCKMCDRDVPLSFSFKELKYPVLSNVFSHLRKQHFGSQSEEHSILWKPLFNSTYYESAPDFIGVSYDEAPEKPSADTKSDNQLLTDVIKTESDSSDYRCMSVNEPLSLSSM